MDEEYFVTPLPRPVPEPSAEVDLERLDVTGLHQPIAVPTWLRALVLLGRLALAAGVLVLVALPLLGLLALFRFLDSLPW